MTNIPIFVLVASALMFLSLGFIAGSQYQKFITKQTISIDFVEIGKGITIRGKNWKLDAKGLQIWGPGYEEKP